MVRVGSLVFVTFFLFLVVTIFVLRAIRSNRRFGKLRDPSFMLLNHVSGQPNTTIETSIHDKLIEKVIHISNCGCNKAIQANGDIVDSSLYKTSTCGPSAFERGRGQKVFSFSFFDSGQDNGRQYFEGIESNIKAVQELFPTWVVRVYHNVSENKRQDLCLLECQYHHLDLCDIKSNPIMNDLSPISPRLWRFLPMVDEQVTMVNFRDLDSLVTKREAAAVDAWIGSKHPIHIMRDHPGHNMPILAGMWGVKMKGMLHDWRKVVLSMFMDPLSEANPTTFVATGSEDQILLEKYVWTWAQDLALQHDSFTCEMYSKTTPWPTQREKGVNNYVGAPTALQSSVQDTCPERCRPKNRKDWIQC